LQDETKICTQWFLDNGMKANADKFHAILSHKSDIEPISLSLDGHIILCEKNVNLLGMNLDDMLSFDLHVKGLCKKAGKQINVLKRIANKLDISGKLAVYKSFVLCQFNYCPIVWNFCGKKNIRCMEKLQERALRMVYNDQISTYEELLTRSNLKSLHVRNMKAIALQVFKCINSLGPKYLHDMFIPKCTKYNFRDGSILHQNRFYTVKYGFLSFKYHGAKIWNSLPPDLKTNTEFSDFKRLLNNWEGPFCNCNHCFIG